MRSNKPNMRSFSFFVGRVLTALFLLTAISSAVAGEAPALNALNERLRDDFIKDAVAGIARWNRIIEKAPDACRSYTGCFRFQVALLVILIVLTPLSVFWDWPPMVSTILLFVVIALLLVTGQTIIFLLRLVASDRREGRRRPLASQSRTVGELEDEASAEPANHEDGPPPDASMRE